MLDPPVSPRGATIADWIAFAARRFDRAHLAFGHGTHNARDEAVWLLVNVSGVPFERVDACSGRPLTAAQSRRARRLIEARIQTRKPLAYLLREAWLRDRRFYVDERVIVPRSFIAELLPDGLDPWLPQGARVKRILDLCTGSACLAILAALAFPMARVDASDLSAAALAVARRNVLDYGLERRVRLIRSDLFRELPPRRYDLILANPPYVAARAMRRLPAEYRHEPRSALEGGREGLQAIEAILREARRFLAPHGLLLVESGRHRRALERRYPRLAFTWMPTSAGNGLVFMLPRQQLA